MTTEAWLAIVLGAFLLGFFACALLGANRAGRAEWHRRLLLDALNRVIGNLRDEGKAGQFTVDVAPCKEAVKTLAIVEADEE